MEKSVAEIRKIVEAHYAERGNVFDPNRSDAEVLRVYHNLQEEMERAKHIGCEDFECAELHLKRTYWIDEPTGSQ